MDFILNMVLTFTILCLPMIIYRFGIKKVPIEEKTAKKINFIYLASIALVLFIINLTTKLISGIGILGLIVWGLVNYFVLTAGSNKLLIEEYEKAKEQEAKLQIEKNAVAAEIINESQQKTEIEIP